MCRRSLDEALLAMAEGHIVFTTPEAMQLAEERRVWLLLGVQQSVSDLNALLQTPGARESATIRVTDRMEARLTGPGFVITAFSPDIQAVSATDVTSWDWVVKAVEPGRHTLHLSIHALVRIDGVPTARPLKVFDRDIVVTVSWSQQVTLVRIDGVPTARPLKVFDRDIVVTVSWSRQVTTWAGKYWQWLAGVALIPLVKWGWTRWKSRGRRPERTSPPHQTPARTARRKS